jgi:hypothetical protein
MSSLYKPRLLPWLQRVSTQRFDTANTLVRNLKR